ncbi:MAG: type II/IV secretion system protein [Candidatus Nealsonbacteria bacterium]|nr:type II/IV secretion system protein [Candidatus Nealsonbacteria bacterium]
MTSTATLQSTQPLIVRLLLEKGRLSEENLETLREARSKEKLTLEEILIRKGFASERNIAAAYSDYYLIPLFDPQEEGIHVSSELAEKLTEKLCRDHLLAPVATDGETLDVAFFTPNELHIVDELRLITGLNVRVLVAPLSVVEGILGTLYDDSAWPGNGVTGNSTDFEQVDEGDEADAEEDDSADIVHLDQPPPPGRDGRIIRFVNQVLEQAFRAGASDIHIEPFENRSRIRLRTDGSLAEITPPPQSLYTPIISRLKVLAKLDIAEKRVPQDGAISLRSGEKRVDLRVSTVPTVYGEKVVMRVLDKSAISLKLTDMGLDERQSKDLTDSIHMPHGLMLVTGPTGSGKSTTLYACLNMLNGPNKNICTVEDPVEYKFDGINQIQVKSQVGLTFASALRSFLRQDPDILMVGEVRDAETAQICLRAALTGHFVLSTLHTNDALAAINRLQDMDIEPFLLASTLRVLVAQRLIRRLCPHCRQPYDCNPETAERFGLRAGEAIYRPAGCRECRDIGYRGRVGVFEVIRVTASFAELIQSRAPLSELHQAAAAQGIQSLAANALDKVRQGLTSLEEALSITISEEDQHGG